MNISFHPIIIEHFIILQRCEPGGRDQSEDNQSSSGNRELHQHWTGCDGKGEVRPLIICLVTLDNKEGGAIIVTLISETDVCAMPYSSVVTCGFTILVFSEWR